MFTHWIVVALLTAQPPAAQAAAANTASLHHEDDAAFTHFFQHLGEDFHRMATPETGAELAAGLGGAALFHHDDARLAAWMQARPGTSSLAAGGNAIGNGWTQAGVAVGTWSVGALSGHAALEHLGADLIRAQAVDAVITDGLKAVVTRTRPNGSSHSFPSGHTSATFATAAVLESHFGWGAGAAGYALGSFVGWSRLRSNNHWLSDVVAGATIGLVSGRAVSHGHRHLTWTVAPVAVRGGAGLVVTRVSK